MKREPKPNPKTNAVRATLAEHHPDLTEHAGEVASFVSQDASGRQLVAEINAVAGKIRRGLQTAAERKPSVTGSWRPMTAR